MTCRRNGVDSVVSPKVYTGFLQPDQKEDAVTVLSAVVESVMLGLDQVVSVVEVAVSSSEEAPFFLPSKI
ncbi:hypothetical protein L195_g038776, partial [Trifolium pratense]